MAAINRRFGNRERFSIGPCDLDVIDSIMISNAEAQCCFDLGEITSRWLDATLLSMIAGDDLDDGAVGGNAGSV